MTLFEAIFNHPLSYALSWTLLHFLWQGALVALVLTTILTLLRGWSSNIRYLVSSTALALMLILPAATFWKISRSPHVVEVDEMMFQTASMLDVRPASAESNALGEKPYATYERMVRPIEQRQLAEQLNLLLPWLLFGWLLGVFGLTVRVLSGLVYTQRLICRDIRPLEIHWQKRLSHISKQLSLTKSIRLLESKLVRVPTTVGWLRPVILLPASALTGLTPQQLELILAHELAHIRRHDYFVNLFQVMVETFLFYHPAVWWVSQQVRIEREHACDDMAVAVCGDPVAYARALTKVERLRKDKLLISVSADGGNLSGRIRRLIETSHTPRRSYSPFICLLFVAAVFTILVCAQNAFSHKKQTATLSAGQKSTVVVAPPTDRSQKRTANLELHALGDETVSLIASDDTTGEDAEVRRVALAALGNRAGTVIVMDPRTGRVYTVVNQEWAVRRSWRPASIIKLVTGVAGVKDKKIDPKARVRVSTKAKPLDLTEALAYSDNSYFSSVGESVGSERLINYARELGFGEQTGINYLGEISGSLPLSIKGNYASRIGAYGEGIETTPIQLATLVSAIANGGKLIIPRVPRTPQESVQFEPEVRRTVMISRDNLECLIPGMIAAVSYGTAKGATDPMQSVAGKTGTFLDNKSSVGIFASYAPVDDPRLVVVVLTRGENQSGAAAASIAGDVYRALGLRS